ncbi:ABC transporter ATP-binding protein [Nocardia cyriacigeorgica]|uniref:ABC transporter ATP-binding protein n=1 Tax=Nocardia cyriacigeorgica TaxID=135487 RepID=A0A6P1D7L9_9NOCA|nr:ABC transporter ATP-binding protein [Nocardia cyriacigeorgica]NEW42217.1 ABC transporter ATP-binding protein [Nocardia cyriacigeorgica]NEW44222.1 ABC transporter ATP-binding protein [Nocardia cyriacigeorgica]NEW56952.1 ABC transporter ATP-binding protein [Nocardia cyriacigeorgica]
MDVTAVGAVGADAIEDPAFEIRSATLDYTPAGATSFSGVRDLSITGRRGELLVLVGHSGCGKTTALNLMGGLIHPAAGSVSVLGTSPAQARSRMGYMFARDALYPWRTARRNVELGMEIAHIGKVERRERAMDMLRRVGLEAAADRYPWQLSQGMRQRVALARTWVMKPALILMDEPFSALDAQTRDVVREEFLNVWSEERQTVVFVTHDLNEALLIADRIVAMREGRVVIDMSVDLDRPRNALESSAEYRDMLVELREALNQH